MSEKKTKLNKFVYSRAEYLRSCVEYSLIDFFLSVVCTVKINGAINNLIVEGFI